MPRPISYARNFSFRKRKALSKSLQSIHSHCQNGYDHLYSEPCNYCDQNAYKNKSSKRCSCFSSRKKRYNLDDSNKLLKKKRNAFFRFKKSWKTKKLKECKSFLDTRDCNSTESYTKNTLQDLCQGGIQSAKQMTKTIYNKLRYGYNYKFSFSTVIYSDRYFKYHLTLDTNLMPMKCFISNDIGSLVLYKKFSKFQKNQLGFFIRPTCSTQDIPIYTRHYMPIFTPWSIKPYSPGIGPLLNFGEVFLFCNIDRRFSHRSIFEDIQKYNENNRHVNENYKPLYDIAIQCREILDYDEYIISFYSHIGDVGRKQLQPLIYLENKELSYRLPERGKDHRSFSKEQIHKMRKQGKKHELYQPMIMKPETTKFPIPDFALSDDQLLMRKTGSLYEKIKSDPDKLYDNFAKESPHISAANLVNAEIHQSVKTVYKTYSTGGKKVLNTEIRKRSLSIDRESIPSKSYYNNGRSASDNLNVIEKHEERNKAVSALPHLDRNNMIVMEPLLLMQTLNEDRQKRRQELSIKHQKIIIRVMLTCCTIVYTFALIVFYFYSLS